MRPPDLRSPKHITWCMCALFSAAHIVVSVIVTGLGYLAASGRPQLREFLFYLGGFSVSVAPLFGVWWAYVYVVRYNRSIRYGYCAACDYDLTGNVSGVCPECGATVVLPSETASPLSAPQRTRPATANPNLDRPSSVNSVSTNPQSQRDTNVTPP